MTPEGTAPVGLCGACAHARVIRSDRGSIFYLCQLSFEDPRFPKYPRLPVLECSGYRAQENANA
jgi:hypothetical protein